MAWRSTAGFHQGSYRITVSAAVKFRPVPSRFQAYQKHGNFAGLEAIQPVSCDPVSVR